MENIKSVTPSEWEAVVSKYSPFLAEVRKRILVTLCVFSVATVGGFIFYEDIIKFVIEILSLKGINIVFTSPFQFINLAISCGIVSGLTLTLPLIIIQILSFLRPALKIKEFRMVMNLLPFSIILFAVGFAFGALVMKWQIEVFLDKSVSLGIGNILDVSRLLTTVLLTSIFMGISFQFPIIILILIRLGVIKHQQLRSSRKWVYLGSFIFSMLLPMDSILADVLITLPLIVLFELTLMLNRVSAYRNK